MKYETRVKLNPLQDELNEIYFEIGKRMDSMEGDKRETAKAAQAFTAHGIGGEFSKALDIDEIPQVTFHYFNVVGDQLERAGLDDLKVRLDALREKTSQMQEILKK